MRDTRVADSRHSREGGNPPARSFKKIPGRAKAFHAKAQSRRGRKKQAGCRLRVFAPWHLCVRLFIVSQLPSHWDAADGLDSRGWRIHCLLCMRPKPLASVGFAPGRQVVAMILTVEMPQAWHRHSSLAAGRIHKRQCMRHPWLNAIATKNYPAKACRYKTFGRSQALKGFSVPTRSENQSSQTGRRA